MKKISSRKTFCTVPFFKGIEYSGNYEHHAHSRTWLAMWTRHGQRVLTHPVLSGQHSARVQATHTSLRRTSPSYPTYIQMNVLGRCLYYRMYRITLIFNFFNWLNLHQGEHYCTSQFSLTFVAQRRAPLSMHLAAGRGAKHLDTPFFPTLSSRALVATQYTE